MATSVKKIALVTLASVKRITNAYNMSQELLYSSLFPNANLKAYYRLVNGALTTDSSGNGYTMTTNASVTDFAGLFAKCGGDFGAVGAGRYLNIDNNLGISGGSATISLWYQGATTTRAGDHPAIAGLFDQTTNTGLQIGINTTGFYGTKLKQTLSWNDCGATAFSANTWYMLSLTYDTSTLRFYINGVEKGNVAVSGNGTGSTGTYFRLGGGQGEGMGGKMNDAFVFNTNLSVTQLAYLYNLGLKKIAGIGNV